MLTDNESSRTRSARPDLAEVNDASFDSFPASDAPTWSSMHAGPPQLSAPSSPSKCISGNPGKDRDLGI
jgi:hypothetical protein